MPNISSAKKRVRQTIKKTRRNNLIKSQIKYSVKKFGEALKSADSENIKLSLKNAIRAIDKAVSKGVLHKNTAARKKSSLYKRLYKMDISAS